MKTKRRNIMVSVVGLVIVLLLVGPFLVPVRPLEGLLQPEQLADPDSLFTDVGDITVHYIQTGSGEPVFLLLHGFGASTFSWHAVMEPLGEHGTAIAYDRPAFGLTERPLTWEGENPYSTAMQPQIALGLLDVLGKESAILVGNSAGGTLAVHTALLYPERVDALILISPAIYTGGGAPDFVRPLLKTPQLRHLGPLVSRAFLGRGDSLLDLAWHNPSLITPQTRAGYSRALQVENWDVALWEMTVATAYPDLVSQLDELTMPVLVITGDDDRIVPTADSVRLAGEIPGAELVVIPQCGHVSHEECPDAVMAAIDDFLSE